MDTATLCQLGMDSYMEQHKALELPWGTSYEQGRVCLFSVEQIQLTWNFLSMNSSVTGLAMFLSW